MRRHSAGYARATLTSAVLFCQLTALLTYASYRSIGEPGLPSDLSGTDTNRDTKLSIAADFGSRAL